MTLLEQPDNSTLTDDEYELVRKVVHEHCGIALGPDKKSLVRARLGKPLRAGGFETVTAYLQSILKDRGGRPFLEFIDVISTNLTSFYREADHFDFLSQLELPRLLPQKRSSGDGRLLAWSAACSTGEEPYTLAMTLLEAMGDQTRSRSPVDLRILASDISTRVLKTARTGRYRADQLNAVPEPLRRKYFTRAGDQYQISPRLQSIVQFRHLNLIEAWPFRGAFDFIFCRNVMIYFDRPTQTRLVERFWQSLRPGGLLFTGHSESLSAIGHRFEGCHSAVYRRSV